MSVRIGVALSSGGAAGLAHIGVLEELIRAGIDVECVVGTSAGAMVGAAFAAGRLDEFRDRMLTWRRRRRLALFDPIWPRGGVLGGRRVMDLLGPCATGRIEDLPLDYAAIAADLDSGQRIILRQGDVRDAIRASIAIPGLLAPQPWRGRSLVDGALVDPVPIGPVRELGATFVIASSVIGSEGTALSTRCFATVPTRGWNRLLARIRSFSGSVASLNEAPLPAVRGRELDGGRAEGLATTLCKASAVVQTNIAAARLREEPPDFLIAPRAYDIGIFEVWRAAEAIESGRQAVRAALDDLLAAIERAEECQASSRWWPRSAAVAQPVAA